MTTTPHTAHPLASPDEPPPARDRAAPLSGSSTADPYAAAWSHGSSSADISAAAPPHGSSSADTYEAPWPHGSSRIGLASTTPAEETEIEEDVSPLPGLSGLGAALLTLVVLGACAGLNVVLSVGLTLFFDLCFVAVCLVAAMAVGRRGFFTVGVLPPLAFGAVIGAVAFVSPELLAPIGGFVKAFLSGLAEHATGLVAGYAVALVTIGCRVGAARTT